MRSIRLVSVIGMLILVILNGCAKQAATEIQYVVSDYKAAGTFGEVTSFGSNPGALKMYQFVPGTPASSAPLVVVFHGCQQYASGFKTDTGWDKLADKYGFYVVFPEQGRTENKTAKTGNQYGCFNWGGFYGDMANLTRGQGENLSVISMVNYMKSKYPNIDPNRIYVTGLSAGAAMANVMLATWPDVFKAGAPMAGIPYYCANSVDSAYGCMGITSMFQPRTGTGCTSGEACMDPTLMKTPAQWGDKVRAANPSYTGPWPKVMVWQGDKDQYVDEKNMVEIMEQWTNVHGISQTPSTTGVLKSGVSHEFKEYKKDGQTVVATVLMTGMQHGITVDPGTAADQGGATGTYAFDKNIYSSYYAAVFFGITSTVSSSSSVATSTPVSSVASSVATSTPVSSVASSVATSTPVSSAASSTIPIGNYTMVKSTGGTGTITYNLYVPKELKDAGVKMPLVVAIHGCYNTGFEAGTAWTTLGQKYGFAVMFPMKGGGNSCFANSFASGDWSGEKNTIIGFINTAKGANPISSVYVTGLSAGTGTVNCLLEYNSTDFAGGAPMSGPDCQSAGTAKAGLKVIVWHTDGDSFSNALPGVANKYLSANGGGSSFTSLTAGTIKTGAKSHKYYNYQDKVAYVVFSGMTHGVAVDPGTGTDQGGSTASGTYCNDWDLYSPYYTAKFWGILGTAPVSSSSASSVVVSSAASSVVISSAASSVVVSSVASSEAVSSAVSSAVSDTTAPTVAISAPVEKYGSPAQLTMASGVISGTASDNIGVARVDIKFYQLSTMIDTVGTLTKTVTTTGTNSWTYALSASGLAKYKYYRVEANAYDAAGNVSAVAKVRIYILY